MWISYKTIQAVCVKNPMALRAVPWRSGPQRGLFLHFRPFSISLALYAARYPGSPAGQDGSHRCRGISYVMSSLD